MQRKGPLPAAAGSCSQPGLSGGTMGLWKVWLMPGILCVQTRPVRHASDKAGGPGARDSTPCWGQLAHEAACKGSGDQLTWTGTAPVRGGPTSAAGMLVAAARSSGSPGSGCLPARSSTGSVPAIKMSPSRTVIRSCLPGQQAGNLRKCTKEPLLANTSQVQP